MEEGKDSKSHPRSSNPHWYEEFGLISRFPHPPFDAIRNLSNGIQEPQIFLKPGKENTDIVVRLPGCSDVIPPSKRKAFARFGLTLPKAFQDVLWEKVHAEGSTIWAELADLSAKAYFRTWVHWFELHYSGHFHPAADLWLKQIKEGLASSFKITRRGRRPASDTQSAGLCKRYTDLLPICTRIHRAAQRAVPAHGNRNIQMSQKAIRLAIWQSVRGSVHGMPGDGYIFGGEAFKRIRRGKGKVQAKLHEPKTWEPQQLAKSLLSFERGLAYQTIQKKLSQRTANGRDRPA
jgi:hypothetical protein